MKKRVVDPRLRAVLDAVRAREDLRARRKNDPVDFVHGFTEKDDRELVGLVAASLAFGNVKAIRMKLRDLFDRLDERPAVAAEDPRALHAALRTWKHRVFRGEDVAKLLIGARRVQKTEGSLGAAFAHALEEADLRFEGADSVREALASFCDRIRLEGGLAAKHPDGRRGPSHVLSNARAGGAAKRLLLFLRWMIRPADGIDLGLWDVPASRLLMPVDVHIHKLSRNLGLTRRKDVSWRTAVEITECLSLFEPNDPTRYDFSLCHMGMLQRCPSKRDVKRCDGCGVKPVCVHWRRDSKGASVRR